MRVASADEHHPSRKNTLNMNLDEIISDLTTERERWTDETVVIQSAQIEATPAGQFHIWGTDAAGAEKVIFSYYPDELSFQSDQFAGRTVAECRKVHMDADVAYLRS